MFSSLTLVSTGISIVLVLVSNTRKLNSYEGMSLRKSCQGIEEVSPDSWPCKYPRDVESDRLDQTEFDLSEVGACHACNHRVLTAPSTVTHRYLNLSNSYSRECWTPEFYLVEHSIVTFSCHPRWRNP
jgi:hypothetical protein